MATKISGHASRTRACIEPLERRCLLSASPAPVPTHSASLIPASFNWKQVNNSPLARLEASAVAVGNKLYLFGGYGVDNPKWEATTETDAFDPATKTWTRMADMPEGLTHIGAATDGRYIYAAGGYVTNYITGWQTFGTRDVWRYDTVLNQWSAFVPLPAPRASGALLIIGSQLHYVDGVDASQHGTTDHWALNLKSLTPHWVRYAPLPFSRNHIAAAVVNGKIYIAGGQVSADDASAACSDVLMWDPLHPAAWQRMPDLPQPRSHAIAFAVDGQLVVVDGSTTGQRVLSSIIAFNPLTNNWSTLTNSFPAARIGPAGDIVDGMLVITTGYYQRLRAGTWESLLPLSL